MADPKQVLYIDATGNLAVATACGEPCVSPVTDTCTRELGHTGAHGTAPIPVPGYPPGSPQTVPVKLGATLAEMLAEEPS